MHTQFVLPHIVNLLNKVLTFSHPADLMSKFYFKDNPKIGSRDRKLIADAVFKILRNLLLFRHLSQSSSLNIYQSLAILGIMYEKLPTTNFYDLPSGAIEWLKHVANINIKTLKLTTQYSLPQWLVDELEKSCSPKHLDALANSLLLPANLDIRVNSIKTNIQDVMHELKINDIYANITKYSPYNLRLDSKSSLNNTILFESGWFEIQDEGSQILCQLLNPKRGEMVVDFCAGAGGKTLALGALMRSMGRIYAFDTNLKRLQKMKPRLARSGLSNVYSAVIKNENDTHIKRLHNKIDKVFLDVPCSSIGTLRRNPDLKWRYNQQNINELNATQASILDNGAKLLKNNGLLVYATCSLLQQENEAIVENFLAKNTNFKLVSAYEVLAKQGINIENIDNSNYLKLYPHIHNTDGFFAALLCKQA